MLLTQIEFYRVSLWILLCLAERESVPLVYRPHYTTTTLLFPKAMWNGTSNVCIKLPDNRNHDPFQIQEMKEGSRFHCGSRFQSCLLLLLLLTLHREFIHEYFTCVEPEPQISQLPPIMWSLLLGFLHRLVASHIKWNRVNTHRPLCVSAYACLIVCFTSSMTITGRHNVSV